MLEDEMSAKRASKLKEIQLENKRLALEKRQRDDSWKQDQQRQNQNEITDPNQTAWFVAKADWLHADIDIVNNEEICAFDDWLNANHLHNYITAQTALFSNFKQWTNIL